MENITQHEAEQPSADDVFCRFILRGQHIPLGTNIVVNYQEEPGLACILAIKTLASEMESMEHLFSIPIPDLAPLKRKIHGGIQFTLPFFEISYHDSDIIAHTKWDYTTQEPTPIMPHPAAFIGITRLADVIGKCNCSTSRYHSVLNELDAISGIGGLTPLRRASSFDQEDPIVIAQCITPDTEEQ